VDFAKVDDLKAELSSLRPLNAGEIKRLRDDVVIDNTYNSNAIEGNTLTLRETALILEHGITIGEKPLKDHLEAIGHRDAFQFVYSLVDSNEPLTERVIKQIHSLVLINEPMSKGVYRNVSVYIRGAKHAPPQPYLIQTQMETLIRDYGASNKHVIENIAEFHLRFEGIHPFIDGNGRTGRLLMNFELMKAGYLPITITYADRKKYYNCFDDYYSNAHTTGTLVEIITEYEELAIREHIARIKGEL
jgi:Fic family protein